MAQIHVHQTAANDAGYEFVVTIEDAGDSSRHQVTLAASDYERWGAKSDSPEAFVTRCFEFLLQREPKDAILSKFDVSEIRSYFPEFDRQIRRSAADPARRPPIPPTGPRSPVGGPEGLPRDRRPAAR